jgi:hypothetical protein
MAGRELVVLEETFAVSRLSADSRVPRWAAGGSFLSITRTTDELSVVCRQEQVPPEVRSERGWRCLRVSGTLDFAAVGILASLVEPLARVGVPAFAVSTFDTDYLMVRVVDLDHAVAALRSAGHTVAV